MPILTVNSMWSVPTARSDRAYNWGDSAIAPDAVGQMTAEGVRIPFYLRVRASRQASPGESLPAWTPMRSYYWSPEHKEDQPPYPVTLFVVNTEEVEDTYVRTAARMSRMSLPVLVSCIPVLSHRLESWGGHGVHCGSRSLRDCLLSGLRAYHWD